MKGESPTLRQEEIEGNKNKRLTYFIRTVNCSCSKNLMIIKVIIVIIKIMIVIIKCRNKCRTFTATNTELPVTSNEYAGLVLRAPQKRLIHHLLWWVGVDHAAWIPYQELYPTWFFKNTCNGNINKHNYNNNSNNVTIRLT